MASSARASGHAGIRQLPALLPRHTRVRGPCPRQHGPFRGRPLMHLVCSEDRASAVSQPPLRCSQGTESTGRRVGPRRLHLASRPPAPRCSLPPRGAPRPLTPAGSRADTEQPSAAFRCFQISRAHLSGTEDTLLLPITRRTLFFQFSNLNFVRFKR